MSYETLLDTPSVQSILLIEISAGVPLGAWVAYSSIWRVAVPAVVTLADLEADGVALTQRTSIAAVEANPGSWFQSGEFVYIQPTTGNPFSVPVVGFAAFRFTDFKGVYNGQYYEERLKSIPSLSLRIESRFGGISQIGGGTISLENTDAFFDGLQDIVRWDNGVAVLKLGINSNGATMAYADYRTVGSWALQSGNVSDSQFDLSVQERKINIRNNIPVETFDRETYPFISNDTVRKVIPTIYGRVLSIPAILIEPNFNRFKLCSHAIRGIIGLRKKQSADRTDPRTPDWFAIDAYYQTAFADTVASVKFNGVDLPVADSLDNLIATASTWFQENGKAYINPPLGQVPSASNVVVNYKTTYDTWLEIPYATKDLANGEFTLSSADWDGQQDVVADVIGKMNADGTVMENPSDVFKNILATVGETDLDADAFTAAQSYFELGTDRFGNKITCSKVSLYLDTADEALNVANQINESCGTYFYVNSAGLWVFEACQPISADGLPTYDETYIFENKRTEDSTEVWTRADISFAERHAEDWSELSSVQSNRVLKYSGKPLDNAKILTACLWDAVDALYLAQRILSTQGAPLVTYALKIPRVGVIRAPGEKVVIKRTRGNLLEVCEVLEVAPDLATKQVTMTLGNMRAWRGASGFWMADAAPNWDAGATDDAARNAANGSGFWTDDNGFPDSADARGFECSRWW